jgi:hypothetical protein
MRREALGVLELAHRLVEQPAADLLQLLLSDDLVVGRHDRADCPKLLVSGQKLRREDDESLEAIRASMNTTKPIPVARMPHALHRIEALR